MARKESQPDVATASPESERDGNNLTSGDMARMLHVDLKTIHNWVNQGHLTGTRTKGRHLRFERPEIVRFMRTYGYPIPKHMGATPPRLLVERSLSGAWLKSLQPVASVTLAAGLHDCALQLSSGGHELTFLDLDRDMKSVEDFVAAVRAWEPTRCVALVGVGSKPNARQAFLEVKGDAALPLERRTAVKGLSLWLVGATDVCPPWVEFPKVQ